MDTDDNAAATSLSPGHRSQPASSHSPLDDNPALVDLIRRIRDQEASSSSRQQALLTSIIDRRNSEIASLARVRDEEVASLTAEISALQKQVAELQAENSSLKYLASEGRSPRRIRSPRSPQSPRNLPGPGSAGVAAHSVAAPVPSMINHHLAAEALSIDVKMVYPGLEGIHLRPEAVQKKTFSDAEPYDTNKTISPPTKTSRGASKEETMQVLKAPEERRLIINAGHTPNHSISHLPPKDPAQEARAMAAAAAALAAETTSHALLPDPVDEVVLRGPLMLRNDRDFDEAFLKQVYDKLEMHIRSQVSSAGPSSPAVPA
jgi:hypothetical protein